jgi:hypothetical protein
VSQTRSSNGFPWAGILSNPIAPDFSAMCTKGAENLAGVQKEWMETLEHARRGWAAHLEAEAKLGADFATKLMAAKAVPDAAAAYHDWMIRRMELVSKEWQKAVGDGQKFMSAFTRIAGTGTGLGGPPQ